MIELAKQLLELTQVIGDLKTRAEVAEARLDGSQQQSQLLLEAKNLWMDRAMKAERKAVELSNRHGVDITNAD